jgi:hypothetical protein
MATHSPLSASCWLGRKISLHRVRRRPAVRLRTARANSSPSTRSGTRRAASRQRPLAVRPCYVLWTVDAVYLSTNVAWLFVLARERYRPDVVGWLEVFSYADTNGARTTAHAVQRLRPGTHHRAVTPRHFIEHQHQQGPDLTRVDEGAILREAYARSSFRAFHASSLLHLQRL